MLVGGRCRRKTKYAVRIGCRLDGPADHDALIEQFDIDRLRVGHPRNLSRSFRGHSRTLAQARIAFASGLQGLGSVILRLRPAITASDITRVDVSTHGATTMHRLFIHGKAYT